MYGLYTYRLVEIYMLQTSTAGISRLIDFDKPTGTVRGAHTLSFAIVTGVPIFFPH
jgi:hypothetical protein